MTPKLQIRMLTLILGGFLAISLLGAIPSQLFDPGQALAAGQRIERSGEVRPAEGAAIYLPLVTKWHDPLYISPFGIVMYGDVDDAAGLRKMQEAGSKRVTTALNWSAIEPARGSYDWSSFDTKAQNAQAAGLDLFVLFTGNPSWAASLPGGPVYDIRDLENFVTLMAERYDCDGASDAPGSPCVHDWSFYAEPDNGDIDRAREGKGYWGHNGAGYASMLSRVSPAIRQADPKAKVLIGGIAYDYFEPGGPFVRSFLADTLRALNGYPGGARAYIAAVAFHYYPINSPEWPSIREKALEVRGIMSQHNAGDLLLICPEMGYWSAEEAGSSETRQACRLVQMFVRGISVGLEYMSWYAVFDASPEQVAQHPTEEHGLFPWQNLNSPKQSYYAYQTLTRELDKAAYLREFQAANVEGYVFQMPGGSEKTVLWATTTSSSASFGPCIDTVHVLGYSQTINDGGAGDADGRVNGQVLLQLSRDTPVYVEPCR